MNRLQAALEALKRLPAMEKRLDELTFHARILERTCERQGEALAWFHENCAGTDSHLAGCKYLAGLKCSCGLHDALGHWPDA